MGNGSGDGPVDDDFLFYAPGAAWENTVAIIPPSTQVPLGVVVVVQGQGADSGPTAGYDTPFPGYDKVYTAPLTDSAGNLARPPSPPPASYASPTPLPVPDTYYLGSDHSVVRLPDNSLLVMKDGFTWGPIRGAEPSWFNDRVLAPPYGNDHAYLGRPGAFAAPPAHYAPGPSGEDDPHLYAKLDVLTLPGLRWATTAFHSVNGQDWSLIGVIDLGAVDGSAHPGVTPVTGKYAVPRPWGWNPAKKDSNGNTTSPAIYHPDSKPGSPYQAQDTAGNFIWWAGGGDHSWAYACPFTGAVYIAFGYVSGTSLSGTLLFRSIDGGKSWRELPYPGNDSGSDPVAMTTDSEGRLYILQPTGGQPPPADLQLPADQLPAEQRPPTGTPQYPRLMWTRGSGVDAADQSDFGDTSIWFLDGQGKAVPTWLQPDSDLVTHNAWTPTLARCPSGDTILVGYHAQGETHHNQVALVVECEFSGGSTDINLQTFHNYVEISAADPSTMAVCFPHFIQSDNSPHMLLHYIEVPLAADPGVQCCSKVWEFTADGTSSAGTAMSVAGGGESRFDPPPGGMGDYQWGGVAAVGDQLIYAIQWAAALPGKPGGIDSGIRMNYFVHSLVSAPPPPPQPPLTCGKVAAWLKAYRSNPHADLGDDQYIAYSQAHTAQCPYGSSLTQPVYLE